MAPGARARVAHGGHPPARSRRLNRRLGTYGRNGGSLSLHSVPGRRRGTILGWTLRGGSPPDPPPQSRVEALQPRSSKVPDGSAGVGTASAAAPLGHSPRAPSGLLPTYSKVGPKWPPQSSRGRAPRRLSAPPGGVRVGRAPGWGRRAASCLPERQARALGAPLLRGSARPPARAPRSPRPPGAAPRAAHAPGAGDIPPLPATPARAGARFSRAETLDPTFPGAAGRPPARRAAGPRSPAKGSGSSRPLQRPAPCQEISECPGRSSDTARRKQIALAPSADSSVIPTRSGCLLEAVSEVPTLLLPCDLHHVPSEGAIRPRRPGGRISGGLPFWGEKNLSSEKGGECARAGEKPSLSGLVRAAEPRSLGVAAGNCGGSLPLSALLPPSLPPGGRGGGEVTSAPRLAPPPRGGDRGAPAGSASRTVAAASGQAGPASLPQRCLAVQTAERLPGRRRVPAPERPRGAHLSAGFLAGLLRPRFPRLQLQVMLFPFCR
uniref:Uncharacterized protein n=1 Tax=Rangifer tarandus platyrhynchus TaxID=3082113 RepID=A0ACB0F4E6_RANTA|nr:unnamed protein product [Rangifer tarandus platyrhynchus]